MWLFPSETSVTPRPFRISSVSGPARKVTWGSWTGSGLPLVPTGFSRLRHTRSKPLSTLRTSSMRNSSGAAAKCRPTSRASITSPMAARRYPFSPSTTLAGSRHRWGFPPQDGSYHVKRSLGITSTGHVVMVVQGRGRVDFVDDAAASMKRNGGIGCDHVDYEEIRAHQARGAL